MGLLARLHRALDHAFEVPPLGSLRRRARDRRFERGGEIHAFRGVFETYEAAHASAPTTLPTGYDNAASAELYARDLDVGEYDYPALFWVGQSMQEGMRSVLDLGGSVGIKFVAFGKYLDFPSDLVWRVLEVPAVVKRGRELALAYRGGGALQFVGSISDVNGVDLLLASGSLQYLPKSLPEMMLSVTEIGPFA